MRRALIAGAAWLLAATVVAAQDRPPTQRQSLAELAYVLGRSHGLRQLCEGPRDQVWRSWMARLLEREAPDDALNRRLRDSFNTGYASAQAQYPSCSRASRAEAERSAERGRTLARALDGG